MISMIMMGMSTKVLISEMFCYAFMTLVSFRFENLNNESTNCVHLFISTASDGSGKRIKFSKIAINPDDVRFLIKYILNSA